MPVKTVPKKAAKKAAGKVAGKTAKKAAKKAAKKTAKGPGHDLRRAYEHLHRVNILHGELAEGPLAQLDMLSRLAKSCLSAGENKAAADLLRGAEHLAFGSLATREGDPSAVAALTEAAQGECAELLERAGRHWAERDHSGLRGLGGIYKSMLGEARAASKAGALHRALEFARGAEALAHAEAGPLPLPSGAGVRGRLAS